MKLHNSNDMSSFTSAQLVLLNILVTFVVSIATTIISIALLADTPLSITQVVNNVNEYQRERIVDAEIDSIREELIASVSGSINLSEASGAVTNTTTASLAIELDNVLSAIYEGDSVVIPTVDLKIIPTAEDIDYHSLLSDETISKVEYKELTFLYTEEFKEFIFSGSREPGQDVVVYGPDERRFVRSYISYVDQVSVAESNLYLVDIPGCFAGGFVFSGNKVTGMCVSDTQAFSGIEIVSVVAHSVKDNEKERSATQN